MSHVESSSGGQVSKECILSILLKKNEQSEITLRHSTRLSSSQAAVRCLQSAYGGFDILRFAVRPCGM